MNGTRTTADRTGKVVGGGEGLAAKEIAQYEFVALRHERNTDSSIKILRLIAEIRAIEDDKKKLTTVCERVIRWVTQRAETAEEHAKDGRFPGLQEASRQDAKSYRATAADIQSVVNEAQS